MKLKKRIVSLVLAVATVLGLVGGATATQTALVAEAATPTCYQQADSRWGGVYFGNWTVAESGCGILSTVNAVNYLTGNFIQPTELAQWGYSNNHYNGSYGQGTVRWNFYPAVTAAFGGKYGFKVSDCQGGTIYSAALKNHLLAGGAAVVHVPNHFMAINAYDSATGKFFVYDSSAAPKRNTSVYGSWLTADEIHGNTLCRVDWFCLVTRTGAAPSTPSTPSTPSETLYTVSANVASGQGSVHFGNGVTSAQVTAGTVVNFQTTPAEGWQVSKIVIGGTEQAVKNNGEDCVYQFTMPQGNCGVSVTFTQSTTLYTVSAVVAAGQGSVHFGDNVTSAQVTAGTVVNYQTTPAAGYKVSSISVGGSAVTVQNNGGDCVYTFTMPKGNCEVSVCFEKVLVYYQVSATVVGGTGGIVHFGLNTLTGEYTTSAEVVPDTVINYQATPDAGYKISQITVGGQSVAVQNDGIDCVYQFTMPASDCEVAVKFEPINTLFTASTSVTVGEGTAHFGSNITEADFHAGLMINFQVTPAEGYLISKITVDGTELTVQNGGNDCVYQFIMPLHDCLIEVEFGSVPHELKTSIVEGEGSAHFGADASGNLITKTQAAVGTLVNVQISPAEGYVIAQIMAGNQQIEVLNGGAERVYQFYMPATDCDVKITFAVAIPELPVEIGGFVKIDGGATWADGTPISSPGTYQGNYRVQKIVGSVAIIGVYENGAPVAVGRVMIDDLTAITEEAALKPTPFVPYEVKVAVFGINIHFTASERSVKVGYLMEGDVVEIVAVRGATATSAGWGKLSVGNQWICLDDCVIV